LTIHREGIRFSGLQRDRVLKKKVRRMHRRPLSKKNLAIGGTQEILKGNLLMEKREARHTKKPKTKHQNDPGVKGKKRKEKTRTPYFPPMGERDHT